VASRRSLILDAVVDGLNEVRTANGWPIDVVASLSLPRDNAIAGESSAARNRAFVLGVGEQLDTRAMDQFQRVRLSIAVDLFPAATAAAVSLFDAVDGLLVSAQKRLLQLIEAEPAFGVAGCEDADMRWDLFRPESDTIPGATVTLEVTYRHQRTDPEVYP